MDTGALPLEQILEKLAEKEGLSAGQIRQEMEQYLARQRAPAADPFGSEEFTFDKFIVGPSNKFAYAAAKAVGHPKDHPLSAVKATGYTQQIRVKLPESIEQRQIVVLDPMLATGGSAVAAVDFIKKQGGTRIKFMSVIASPEGVSALMKAHPDIQLYVGCLDRCLNEDAYICPGLGDAGDRIFGTV